MRLKKMAYHRSSNKVFTFVKPVAVDEEHGGN